MSSSLFRIARTQVRLSERVRVQAPPVNFHAQQFLQPHIAQPDIPSKVVEHRKLACLVRRLEYHLRQAEFGGESIGEGRVEAPAVVEQTHSTSALPRLHYKLYGARVQPSLAVGQ